MNLIDFEHVAGNFIPAIASTFYLISLYIIIL